MTKDQIVLSAPKAYLVVTGGNRAKVMLWTLVWGAVSRGCVTLLWLYLHKDFFHFFKEVGLYVQICWKDSTFWRFKDQKKMELELEISSSLSIRTNLEVLRNVKNTYELFGRTSKDKKIVNKLSDNQPSSRKSTPGKGEAIFSSEEISLKYLHKFEQQWLTM